MSSVLLHQGPAGAATLRVEVTPGLDDLPAMRARWDELFLSRRHEPSVSFEWTRAMARHHVRSGDRCYLVRLHRQGTLVGLVPLVAREVKLAGQRVTVLAPISEENNTHSDLLLETLDDESVLAFLEGVFQIDEGWDCFRMARLLDEGPLVPVLRRCLAHGRRRHLVRDGLPAYVLHLPTSFESYLAARSAKFRNHLKRVERRLAGAGRVEVHELTPAGDFELAFDALLQVERASWKTGHGTSIASIERQAGFYRDFGAAALGSGRLRLQWLTLDARPIAYNLGYLTGGGYHYLKTSYDAASRPLSPATFLRARLIESLIAEQVTLFDFPGEPYEWEAQWTDAVRWRSVCTVYPRTVRGRALAAIEGLRHWPRPRRTVDHVDPRAG